MMDLTQKIKSSFNRDRVYYTRHAKIEMEKEEFGRIYEYEVYEAITNGEEIEEYPESKPYPCILIFGRTKVNRSVTYSMCI